MANDEILAGKLTEIANLLREQREDQEFDRQEAKAAASESKVGQEEAKQEEVSRKEEQIENQEETIGILERINKNFEGGFEGKGKNVFANIAKALGLLGAPVAAVSAGLGFLSGILNGLKQSFAIFTPKTFAKVSNFFTKEIPTLFKGITLSLRTSFALFKANLFGGIDMTVRFLQEKIGKFLNLFKKGQLSLPGFGFQELLAKVTDRVNKITERIKPIATRLLSFGKAIIAFTKGLGDDVVFAFGKLKEGSQALLKLGDVTGDTIKRIPPTLEFLKNVLRLAFTPFEVLLKSLKFIAPVAFGIGKAFGIVLGKLLVPFTIVLGAINTIRGFLETDVASKGFIGKLIERIGGAIAGLFNFLIGSILDFVKDIGAFFIGLIPGADGIADAIKGFSFQDMFKGIIEGIFDAFALMFDNPMEALRQAGIGMMKTIDFIRDIVKFVLPPADFLSFKVPEANIMGKRFGGGEINLNPIPKVLYDFANAPRQNFSSTTPNAGASMAVATDMNLDAKAANAASPIVVQNVDGGKTENTNIVQTNYQDNTLTDRDATLSQFGAMPATI